MYLPNVEIEFLALYAVVTRLPLVLAVLLVFAAFWGVAYFSLYQMPGPVASSSNTSSAVSSSSTSSRGVPTSYLPEFLPTQVFLAPGTSENYSVVRVVPLGGDLSRLIYLSVFTPSGLKASLSSQTVSLAGGEQRVKLSVEADSTIRPGKYQLTLTTSAGGTVRNTTADIQIVAKVVLLLGAHFTPATVTVGVGGAVAWVDLDGALSQYDPGTHNVVFADGIASTSMGQYDTFVRTFSSAGSYQYACTFHPGMDGTVTVTTG
jgi:plastocyanin